MSDCDKIIFYPLSALHVVVTDLVYTRWRDLIHIWRKRQLNEECRRLFLRLKSDDNKKYIIYCKNVLLSTARNNNNIQYLVKELMRLYELQIEIEKKNIYYRSIYWEDEQNL